MQFPLQMLKNAWARMLSYAYPEPQPYEFDYLHFFGSLSIGLMIGYFFFHFEIYRDLYDWYLKIRRLFVPDPYVFEEDVINHECLYHRLRSLFPRQEDAPQLPGPQIPALD